MAGRDDVPGVERLARRRGHRAVNCVAVGFCRHRSLLYLQSLLDSLPRRRPLETGRLDALLPLLSEQVAHGVAARFGDATAHRAAAREPAAASDIESARERVKRGARLVEGIYLATKGGAHAEGAAFPEHQEGRRVPWTRTPSLPGQRSRMPEPIMKVGSPVIAASAPLSTLVCGRGSARRCALALAPLRSSPRCAVGPTIVSGLAAVSSSCPALRNSFHQLAGQHWFECKRPCEELRSLLNDPVGGSSGAFLPR